MWVALTDPDARSKRVGSKADESEPDVSSMRMTSTCRFTITEHCAIPIEYIQSARSNRHPKDGNQFAIRCTSTLRPTRGWVDMTSRTTASSEGRYSQRSSARADGSFLTPHLVKAPWNGMSESSPVETRDSQRRQKIGLVCGIGRNPRSDPPEFLPDAADILLHFLTWLFPLATACRA